MFRRHDETLSRIWAAKWRVSLQERLMLAESRNATPRHHGNATSSRGRVVARWSPQFSVPGPRGISAGKIKPFLALPPWRGAEGYGLQDLRGCSYLTGIVTDGFKWISCVGSLRYSCWFSDYVLGNVCGRHVGLNGRFYVVVSAICSH